MKTVLRILLSIVVLAASALANAHPHHDGHVSDHLHFSVGSFALVAFVLLAYWLVSRHLRGRSNGSRRKSDDR